MSILLIQNKVWRYFKKNLVYIIILLLFSLYVTYITNFNTFHLFPIFALYYTSFGVLIHLTYCFALNRYIATYLSKIELNSPYQKDIIYSH